MWVVREAYHFSSMLSLHCFVWESHRALGVWAIAGLSLCLSALMALGQISPVHLMRSGCSLLYVWQLFAFSQAIHKKLCFDYYGQVHLVALLTCNFFLAKVLICMAYYKMVAEGVMFSLTRCYMNWTDLIAFFCRASGAVLHILALSYTLPRSRFLTEISMITIQIRYSRLAYYCKMACCVSCGGKQGRKMCDMPVCYNKKTTEKSTFFVWDVHNCYYIILKLTAFRPLVSLHCLDSQELVTWKE